VFKIPIHKADRAAPRTARVACRLAAATGLVLVVVTLSQEPDELLYAWPPVFRVALAFPLLAIPLTLGCLYFVVRAWREGFWMRYGRMQYTVIALAFTLFLWSLNHIKLLGYHFG
jgi:hypothetical protein